MKKLLLMGVFLFLSASRNGYRLLVKIWRNNNIGWVTESCDAASSFKKYINSIRAVNI